MGRGNNDSTATVALSRGATATWQAKPLTSREKAVLSVLADITRTDKRADAGRHSQLIEALTTRGWDYLDIYDRGMSQLREAAIDSPSALVRVLTNLEKAGLVELRKAHDEARCRWSLPLEG